MRQKTKKTIEVVNFLHYHVNQQKLLKPNQSIVLAISGGQDSITLFFMLLQLKDQWSWKLSIVYCNHLWQEDSFYTMLHLFKLAYLLNIRIYLTVTLQKILTEQKARNWRSLIFQRITGFYFFSAILTGHSKSDRVETGLFNIFRGCSTKGVGSLNWTKVVSKESFFKLSKTQFKEIQNKDLRQKINKNEFFVVLLKSSIYCFQRKLETHEWEQKGFKLINKNNITNLTKKFLIYKVDVHFKCNLKNVKKTKIVKASQLKKLHSERKEIFLLLTKRRIFHFFPLLLTKTSFLLEAVFGKGVDIFAYTKKGRKKEKQKDQIKIEIKPLQKHFSSLSRLYQNEYTLVRPFLSLPRFDLKKVCNCWKLPLFPDQSNQKLKYQRNRIRKQILPILRFFFNPQIDTTIFQFIEILNTEQEYMDFITARIVKEIQSKKGSIVELETSFFAVLPLPLRRKVMKQFLEKILKKSLRFVDIEKLLQQISVSRSVIRQEETFSIKKQQKKRNNKQIELTVVNLKKSLKNVQKLKNCTAISWFPSGEECFPEGEELFSEGKPWVRSAQQSWGLALPPLYRRKTFKVKYNLQRDLLLNIINQKKGRYKEHRLIFFPKVGSIFLQSQRVFFIKKNY